MSAVCGGARVVSRMNAYSIVGGTFQVHAHSTVTSDTCSFSTSHNLFNVTRSPLFQSRPAVFDSKASLSLRGITGARTASLYTVYRLGHGNCPARVAFSRGGQIDAHCGVLY